MKKKPSPDLAEHSPDFFHSLYKKMIIFLFLLFITPFAYAKNGIYITIDSGYAKQNGLPSAEAAGASEIETKTIPSANRGGIGYNHDFWNWFGIGLDVGIGRYGKETYSYPAGNGDVYSRTLEFLAFMQFHIKQWDIIGKLGGIRQTIVMNGVNSQEDQTQIRPQTSISTAYNFNNHWAVMFTYAHVFGETIYSFSRDDMQNKTPSLNELLIGVRYSF